MNLLSLAYKPTAEMLASRELEDAKRQLLETERLSSYYAHMSEFFRNRIAALANYTTDETK